MENPVSRARRVMASDIATPRMEKAAPAMAARPPRLLASSHIAIKIQAVAVPTR
jgi:hypothetical protein